MLCPDPSQANKRPYTTIGGAIKHYRKKNKLTQEKLAEKLDLCQASIAHYESGRATPSLKVIQKMSRELGVPVQLLVEHRYTFL